MQTQKCEMLKAGGQGWGDMECMWIHHPDARGGLVVFVHPHTRFQNNAFSSRVYRIHLGWLAKTVQNRAVTLYFLLLLLLRLPPCKALG